MTSEEEFAAARKSAKMAIQIAARRIVDAIGKADPRTVHLAIYSSSRRVRKKNIRRIIRGK